eukprot:CFRG0171T1
MSKYVHPHARRTTLEASTSTAEANKAFVVGVKSESFRRAQSVPATVPVVRAVTSGNNDWVGDMDTIRQTSPVSIGNGADLSHSNNSCGVLEVDKVKQEGHEHKANVVNDVETSDMNAKTTSDSISSALQRMSLPKNADGDVHARNSCTTMYMGTQGSLTDWSSTGRKTITMNDSGADVRVSNAGTTTKGAWQQHTSAYNIESKARARTPSGSVVRGLYGENNVASSGWQPPKGAQIIPVKKLHSATKKGDGSGKAYVPPHLRRQQGTREVSTSVPRGVYNHQQSRECRYNNISQEKNSVKEIGRPTANGSGKEYEYINNCEQSEYTQHSQNGRSISESVTSKRNKLPLIPSVCGQRCSQWMRPDIPLCPHHSHLMGKDTALMAEFYNTHSKGAFKRWTQARQIAEFHPLIQRLFIRRASSNSSWKDASTTAGGVNGGANVMRLDSRQSNVEKLFRRFFLYAIDIDMGTDFTGLAKSMANAHGQFRCLEFGFAPGGMSALILSAHPNTHVVGVSLNPELGGNVYPEELGNHKRFRAVMGDVLDLARRDVPLVPYSCTRYMLDAIEVENAHKPTQNESKATLGYDLAIAGITVSGSTQVHDDNELEIKDNLHFAQLYISLRDLVPGGCLLMRLHLGFRLVDLHIIALLCSLFTARPVSSKPLTEFAMRKTYWVMFSGYKGVEHAESVAALGRLRVLLTEVISEANTDGETATYIKPNIASEVAYTNDVIKSEPQHQTAHERHAYAFENGRYHKPILMDVQTDTLLEKYGESCVAVMSPIWQSQTRVLNSCMEGHTSKLCRTCARGEESFNEHCRNFPYRRYGPCREEALEEIVRAVDRVQAAVDESYRYILHDLAK